MSDMTSHLVRASKFHCVLNKHAWANQNLAEFEEAVADAVGRLEQSLAVIADFYDMPEQEAIDFISDTIGTVSPIAPIQQTPLPALVKAGLAESKRRV